MKIVLVSYYYYHYSQVPNKPVYLLNYFGHFSILLKTVSPKRVVTIVLFMTISGHFLANPLNIFHKT